MTGIVIVLTIIAIWYVGDYLLTHIFGTDKKSSKTKGIRGRWQRFSETFGDTSSHEEKTASQKANEYLEKLGSLTGKSGKTIKKNSLLDKLQGNNIYAFLSENFFPDKSQSLGGKLFRFLLLLIGGVLSLGGVIVRFILRGLYRFFAFLGPTGHYIIRYSLYFPLVSLYETWFHAEGYILIFVVLSTLVGYGVGIYSEDEDDDYQQKMDKVNLIYIAVLASVFIIIVVLRIVGVLPPWHLEWLQVIFDFFTELECYLFQNLFHTSLWLDCSQF